jgi:hypothetical protein
LDFAGSVQQVDATGEVRPGLHSAGTYDTFSLVLLLQHQPPLLLVKIKLCHGSGFGRALSFRASTVAASGC